MPKGSHHAAAKSGPHGKGKKGKKGRHARRFAPPVSRRITPSEGVPDIVARPVSPSLPTVPGYPYLLTDLKRIGIITGIMFIILIVLSLVL